MHAIIVGAGIGGISAALFLLKAGIQVSLLERAEKLREVGAGVQISSNGTIALRELGLLEKIESVAVKPVSFKVLHFETDELVAEFPLGMQSEERYGESFFQVHRADLLDILVDALPEGVLRTGARVEDVLEDNAGVTALLTNGEKINADSHWRRWDSFNCSSVSGLRNGTKVLREARLASAYPLRANANMQF